MKLLCLVLLVAPCAFGQMRPCNDQQLNSCQVKFNKNLGIEDFADWHDPNKLAYALGKIFLRGTSGLLDVCSARQQFYACLGPMYYSCMNPLYFLAHKFTVDQSYGFVGVMHGLHWMCGGGFELSVTNWPCLITTFKQSADDLQKCITTFNSTVSTDPTKLCSASQELLNCYQKPFYDTCPSPHKGEAGYWGCEYMNVALFVHVACPDVKCVVPTASQMTAVPSPTTYEQLSVFEHLAAGLGATDGLLNEQ